MMHLERFGSGPSVYAALHGWGGSHRTFLPLAPYVPPTASLYAADLPGYGRSRQASGTTAACIAETIAAALEALPGDRVTLVGNCSGAIFALMAAAVPGSPVSRLVLIDPFAFVPWYFKVFVHPTIGRYAYYSTFANPVGRWLTNASLRRRRAATSDLTRSFRDVDHEVSLAYLSMLDALGGIARFGDTNVPTEIVYGERTFTAVRQSLPEWKTVLPHARAWQIDGAGHLPIEEAPAQVASIVFEGVPLRGRAA